MALVLQSINPDASISLGPAILNANFTAIQQVINDFEQRLLISSNTLKLTNVAVIPNDSIESATITLTASVGNGIAIAPGGGAATFTVTFDGKITGVNLVAAGTGANKSILGELEVTTAAVIKGDTTVEEELNLKSLNAVITTKTKVISILPAAIGGAATNPIDVSKDHTSYFDCDNGASPLPGSKDINLDLTNLKEGQTIKLQLFRDNTGNGVCFYNGVPASEVFAKVDPTTPTGFVSISSAVLPTFDSVANTRCWMKVQWLQISIGVFRLVVIESENVLFVI